MNKDNPKTGKKLKENEAKSETQLGEAQQDLELSNLLACLFRPSTGQEQENENHGSNKCSTTQVDITEVLLKLDEHAHSTFDIIEKELTAKIADVEKSVMMNSAKIQSIDYNTINDKIARNQKNIRHMVNNFEVVNEQTLLLESRIQAVQKGIERLTTGTVVDAQNEDVGPKNSDNQCDRVGCLAALKLIQDWDKENLTVEECESRLKLHDVIRERWASDVDFFNCTLTLQLDNETWIPIVGDTIITLHPTLHARLCESITSILGFLGIDICIYLGNTPPMLVFPKMYCSTITARHLDVTMETDVDKLKQFVSQFEGIQTITVRNNFSGYHMDSLPTNLTTLRIYAEIGNLLTARVIDFMFCTFNKAEPNTLILCPNSMTTLESYITAIGNHHKQLIDCLELTVSRKRKQHYEQIVQNTPHPEMFAVIEHNGGEDENTIELCFNWSEKGKRIQVPSFSETEVILPTLVTPVISRVPQTENEVSTLHLLNSILDSNPFFAATSSSTSATSNSTRGHHDSTSPNQ